MKFTEEEIKFLEENLELRKNDDGSYKINCVYTDIYWLMGDVKGGIKGNIKGNVGGKIDGNVLGELEAIF